MANGRKSFLDHFRITDDEDEYDEDDYDVFDDDDDEDDFEETFRKKRPVAQSHSKPAPARESVFSAPAKEERAPRESRKSVANNTSTATDKLVSFDNRSAAPRSSSRSSAAHEVYVIKPQEFDDAQTVTDFLKRGRAIVINMEGLQIEPAQRIIDFIGGACYGIGGELKAISANIFIAVPSSIEVSGDLREEILNSTAGFSPYLGE